MQNLGQNPFPLRGLQRFMQKRGMNYPSFPQGGNFQPSNFQGPFFQRPNSQGEAGNLLNTLDVQAPSEKSGGIKAFLSKLGWKRNK